MNTMIGVIGSGDHSERENSHAFQVGRLIAKRGACLVCGGLSGVMEAASRGAFESGGLTLGILPGEDKEEANPFINIPLPTGMGVARNVLVVRASDSIIAMHGGSGTLSEIALSLNIGKTVVDFGGWKIEGTIPANSPSDAVALAVNEKREGFV